MATVTVAFYGGLGNQMFQYAMGRALTIRHKATLQLDLYGFEFDKTYRRKFDLASFNIPSGLTTLRRPFVFQISRALRRVAESVPVIRRLAGARILVEPSPEFNAANMRFQAAHDTYVMGYWQDERY